MRLPVFLSTCVLLFSFAPCSNQLVAQFEMTLETTMPDQNFLTITTIPGGMADGSDGYAAMGYGCSAAEPDNINVVTRDAYGNWSHVGSCQQVDWPADHLFCKAAHFMDAQTGVAVMSQANAGYGPTGIFRTTDGGASWTNTYSLFVDSGLDGIVDMHFFDDMNGVALATWFWESAILKTTDGGLSWVELHVDALDEVHLESLSGLDNGAFMVLGSHFDADYEPTRWDVYRFEDYGDTFEVVCTTPDGTKEAGQIQFLNDDVGYVSLWTWDYMEYDYLYQTLDGGVTWNECSNFSDVMIERMQIQDLNFWNATTGIIVAGDYCNDVACYRGGSVLFTEDAGSSWELLYKIAPSTHNFWDLEVDGEGTGYLVGGDIGNAQGRIYHVNYGNLLGIEPAVGPDPVSVEAWPVPSSGTVHLERVTTEKAPVLVFASDGKCVLETNWAAGSPRLDLDLPAGAFTYQITSDQRMVSGRLLVVE